ncbi:hypothetical protein Pmani_001714 [Petrolisthes manimaculis]|uniref:Immunoglobulin I-set domain-containing protein n=1 Tax=Petrolisthes manimaculis TaxID=1843537 RepID=A0AAE1UL49_9EUCA|nr:hypothetical protein Pmani_001714 [Petrolisthes manimaculis]
MGQKCEAPKPLQKLMAWDVEATNTLVKMVETRYDPMTNYRGYLKGLEVEAKITDNEASITVKMVEEMDCGEYRLKLYNDCGVSYTHFTINLLDKLCKPSSPEPLIVLHCTGHSLKRRLHQLSPTTSYSTCR